MKISVSDSETTCAMMEALQKRYARPEWVLLTEVPDGTGIKASRRADAFAYNLFPSKGNITICFELKASKNDLKRELEDGTKANAIGKFADYFYLVCPNEIIDSSMLLPKTWGVLSFKDGKLRQTKKPELLKSQPMDRNFIAALLQSMLRFSDTEIGKINNNINKIVYKKTQEQLEFYTESIRKNADQEINKLKSELDAMSAWSNAMRQCYEHDFHYISCGGLFEKWYGINSKTIDDIIKNANLIKDLAAFLHVRESLEATKYNLTENLKRLEFAIKDIQDIISPADEEEGQREHTETGY